MKTAYYTIVLSCVIFLHFSCASVPETKKGLKDYFYNHYLIGAALYPEVFNDMELNLFVLKEFNSITPENDMKWERIHPTLKTYSFARADKIVEYTQANNIKLIGHTLVWHSQMGKGIFTMTDAPEDTLLVDSVTLMNRVKEPSLLWLGDIVERYTAGMW
jgi:endo-1,4-beta-xylanase